MAMVRVLALLCGVFGMVCCHGHSCVMSQIQVQKDFDLHKLNGHWYEIKFVSYQGMPEEYRIRDHARWLTYKPMTQQMDILGTGRYGDNDCFRYKGKLTTTSEPGKLNYTRPETIHENAVMVSSPHWIISTDYKNLMLTFSCQPQHVMANGTCDVNKVDSSVWSRSRTVPSKFKGMVDDKIRHLCLDPSKYLAITHMKECRMMMSGASSVTALWYSLVAAVVALSTLV